MRIRSQLLWIIAIGFLTQLGHADDETAKNVTKCPDCLDQVSKRALLCPHCGCPGEAIKTAVKVAEEAARPKALVSVIADKVKGFGVAIRDADATYVILDPFLLADSMKLELHDLVTGDNLPYTGVQLAENAPLMRLEVKSDNIAFKDLSSLQGEPTAFLDANGTLSDKEHAIVGLNAEGNVSSLLTLADPTPLHTGMKWNAVSPKPLREQINLLARMKRERDSGQKPQLTTTGFQRQSSSEIGQYDSDGPFMAISSQADKAINGQA